MSKYTRKQSNPTFRLQYNCHLLLAIQNVLLLKGYRSGYRSRKIRLRRTTGTMLPSHLSVSSSWALFIWRSQIQRQCCDSHTKGKRQTDTFFSWQNNLFFNKSNIYDLKELVKIYHEITATWDSCYAGMLLWVPIFLSGPGRRWSFSIDGGLLSYLACLPQPEFWQKTCLRLPLRTELIMINVIRFPITTWICHLATFPLFLGKDHNV